MPVAIEPDLIAYDDRGRPLMVIEVKSRGKTSDVWAAQFRRNLLSHGTLPDAPFFLIATLDRLYFWRQSPEAPAEESPHFTLDANSELKPYFARFGQAQDRVGRQTLALLVFSWLQDLADAPQVEDSSRRWLADSGLRDALGRSRIELGAVQ